MQLGKSLERTWPCVQWYGMGFSIHDEAVVKVGLTDTEDKGFVGPRVRRNVPVWDTGVVDRKVLVCT